MPTNYSNCLWACCLVLVLVAGCALQQDLYSLDHRLAALERHSLELEKQGRELKQQTDTLLQGGAANPPSLSTDDRQRYAELAARIQAYEDRMRAVSGRLDEMEQALSRKQGGSEAAQQRMDKMAASVGAVQKRVTALEQKFKLQQDESVKKVTASPPAGSTSAATDTALYDAAKKQFDAGDRPAARKGFETLLTRYPQSSLANNAQFWIAETYYQEKWYEKAILEYQKVIENYPSGSKRPAAMLKQAFAFLEIKEAGNARLILKELVAQYPETDEAGIAKKKLGSLP